MKDLKNAIIIPLSIIIAGGLVAGAIYMTRGGNAVNPGQKKVANDQAITIKPVSNEDHIVGNPDAKIVVVEYSDTECPFCKNFHNTMNQIMADYGKTGNVAWVYRHFPLDSIHPKARKEAEATECAADIGGKDMFWSYINKIFEITPSNNKLDLAQLPVIAKELGLDEKKFNDCLNSGKFADKVNAQYQSGLDAGVEGTPYSAIVVKGTKTVVPINGAQPYSTVKQVIDSLLSQYK